MTSIWTTLFSRAVTLRWDLAPPESSLLAVKGVMGAARDFKPADYSYLGQLGREKARERRASSLRGRKSA